MPTDSRNPSQIEAAEQAKGGGSDRSKTNRLYLFAVLAALAVLAEALYFGLSRPAKVRTVDPVQTPPIVFVRDGDLWTIHADGSSAKLLYSVIPTTSGTISDLCRESSTDPKSARLWYTLRREGEQSLELQSLDSAGQVLGWETGDAALDDISWVPKDLAARTFSSPVALLGQDGAVSAMNMLTEKPEKKFSVAQTLSGHPPSALDYPCLRFSPDGTLLLFNVTAGMGFASYIGDSNGSNARAFGQADADPSLDDGIEWFSWAPDSQHFVGLTYAKGGPEHMLEFDRSGGRTRTLYATAEGTHLASADYSPDGKSIVFTVSDESGASSAWTMNSDGSGQHKLCDDAQLATWR